MKTESSPSYFLKLQENITHILKSPTEVLIYYFVVKMNMSKSYVSSFDI